LSRSGGSGPPARPKMRSPGIPADPAACGSQILRAARAGPSFTEQARFHVRPDCGQEAVMPVIASEAQLSWQPQPEDCRFAAAAELYRYWLSARRDRRFPARADLDPLQMRGVLGNLSLTEVHRAPLRFRLRLVGTNQVARLGFDPTGLWVDEMPTPEYARLLVDRMELIVQRQSPLIVRNRQLMDSRWYDYETLWLPLAADGETIDMLVACQFFTDVDGPF
jgi:hypothetical protein